MSTEYEARLVCDRCGKNPPVIQITGEGSYCADCNNQMMLEKCGI